MTPCGQELEAFLSAVARLGGDDSKVPKQISNALTECMGQKVCSAKVCAKECNQFVPLSAEHVLSLYILHSGSLYAIYPSMSIPQLLHALD